MEDDYLLAQVLSDFLEEAEVNVVGPVGSLDEALAVVENAPAASTAPSLTSIFMAANHTLSRIRSQRVQFPSCL
ncbi:hypothetical protein [Bradyrhizobium rifense]|uniref:hypothetical protein n=1 Tax=Bradyrhizobium rifense TaxID=515499 RepID=UPI001AEE4D81|nr:hypothetical protein [Bradyrhizobium rifense]